MVTISLQGPPEEVHQIVSILYTWTRVRTETRPPYYSRDRRNCLTHLTSELLDNDTDHYEISVVDSQSANK